MLIKFLTDEENHGSRNVILQVMNRSCEILLRGTKDVVVESRNIRCSELTPTIKEKDGFVNSQNASFK